MPLLPTVSRNLIVRHQCFSRSPSQKMVSSTHRSLSLKSSRMALKRRLLACLAGAFVTHSSRLQNLFNGCRSTVRRGLPPGRRTHTILWHHAEGSLTFSMTPSAMSLSRSALT